MTEAIKTDKDFGRALLSHVGGMENKIMRLLLLLKMVKLLQHKYAYHISKIQACCSN